MISGAVKGLNKGMNISKIAWQTYLLNGLKMDKRQSALKELSHRQTQKIAIIKRRERKMTQKNADKNTKGNCVFK